MKQDIPTSEISSWRGLGGWKLDCTPGHGVKAFRDASGFVEKQIIISDSATAWEMLVIDIGVNLGPSAEKRMCELDRSDLETLWECPKWVDDALKIVERTICAGEPLHCPNNHCTSRMWVEGLRGRLDGLHPKVIDVGIRWEW